MNHEPYGILWRGPFTTSTSQADSIISGHAIHWVLSKEVYSSSPRENIEGWEYQYSASTSDMAIYTRDNLAIVSFRGTVTLSDFRDDVTLSLPGREDSISRIAPGIQAVSQILSDGFLAQCTGHSLGGAIARKVSQALSLGSVTFNAAAPPSNPVTTAPGEVDYHIVFDVISAWTHPSIIRIDKGFRPSIYPLSTVRAHNLDLFSNEKKGVIITNDQEDILWKKWFSKLPRLVRKTFLYFIQTKSLPPIL